MLKDDFILEQTELLTRFLKTILFQNKENKELLIDKYPFEGKTLDLQAELVRLIVDEDYNQAENLLFEALEKELTTDLLRLSVWFYNRLLQIDSETLEKNDFSMDEILEGLQEIEKLAVL